MVKEKQNLFQIKRKRIRVILDHFCIEWEKYDIKNMVKWCEEVYKERFRASKFVESPPFQMKELEATLK